MIMIGAKCLLLYLVFTIHGTGPNIPFRFNLFQYIFVEYPGSCLVREIFILNSGEMNHIQPLPLEQVTNSYV